MCTNLLKMKRKKLEIENSYLFVIYLLFTCYVFENNTQM